MKPIYCLLLLGWSLSAAAQKLVIEKGKDTIFVSNEDTLAKIPFKLASAVISNTASVSIRVHSSDATEGTDFELRDEYDAPTQQINITRLENKSGSFKIYAAGGLKEIKIINLETSIRNNGKTSVAIAPLILSPLKKEKKQKDNQQKGPVIKFNLFNDLNIPVYTNDDSERTKVTKHFLKKNDTIPVFINISSVEIIQIDSTEYRIRVVSTDNEEFKSTLKLNSYYEFLTDDKIYLYGKTGSDYIHARDILDISKSNGGEKSQTVTPDMSETQFKVQKNMP